MAIRNIPQKNEIAVNPTDNWGLFVVSKYEVASGKSSTKEMYIITPALKPKEIERNRLFVLFAKNAIALPMPVDNPARSVSEKANKTVLISMLIIFNSV
jgi:hypothetical protein